MKQFYSVVLFLEHLHYLNYSKLFSHHLISSLQTLILLMQYTSFMHIIINFVYIYSIVTVLSILTVIYNKAIKFYFVVFLAACFNLIGQYQAIVI